MQTIDALFIQRGLQDFRSDKLASNKNLANIDRISRKSLVGLGYQCAFDFGCGAGKILADEARFESRLRQCHNFSAVTILITDQIQGDWSHPTDSPVEFITAL